MRWTVHGERSLYDSAWMCLRLVDIELPSGTRFEHHVMRLPRAAAGCVVHDRDDRVLLLWRHRFITDTWGWEIPAGMIDDGEDPATGASREVLEETGWQPDPLRPLLCYHPLNGTSDARFHLFASNGATHVGEPAHPEEAERVEWVPARELPQLIRTGMVADGPSLLALVWCLAFGFET
jgi:8-oxo-dGTP pyrophosphatase MutT (NUDIX family)